LEHKEKSERETSVTLSFPSVMRTITGKKKGDPKRKDGGGHFCWLRRGREDSAEKGKKKKREKGARLTLFITGNDQSQGKVQCPLKKKRKKREKKGGGEYYSYLSSLNKKKKRGTHT